MQLRAVAHGADRRLPKPVPSTIRRDRQRSRPPGPRFTLATRCRKCAISPISTPDRLRGDCVISPTRGRRPDDMLMMRLDDRAHDARTRPRGAGAKRRPIAMETTSFDNLVRRLAPTTRSRRGALRLLGGAAGVMLAGRGLGAFDLVAAKKACRNDGQGCTKRSQCCSGVCKKGTCQHGANQGVCTIEKKSAGNIQYFCQAPGAAFCYCYVTTRGASVCTANNGSACAHCRRNRDCDQITGPGSFCVRFPNCGGSTNTACHPPCPNPAP
jgi:hypothetical protein